MVKDIEFSIIIPTFTGLDTIRDCLGSILAQSTQKGFEVIVVVDGPNSKLSDIVKSYASLYNSQGIDFKIIQFDQNQGRFMARLKGANTARAEQLLFVDDRVELTSNFLQYLSTSSKSIVIPTVIESEYTNFISLTLGLIRRRVYKQGVGDFESFVISEENFDSTPKGTTALWINKNIFISACQDVLRENNLKHISDDTLILRNVLSAAGSMLKSCEAKISYQPRKSSIEELKHIFQRGPKFVNYYFKRGSRYYKFILMSLVTIPSILLLGLFYSGLIPLVLFLLFICLFSAAYTLSNSVHQMPSISVGLILVFFFFGAGVIKGLVLKYL